jgi:beta-lactamase class A
MKRTLIFKLAAGGAGVFLAGILIGTAMSETIGIGALNGEAYEVRLGGSGLTNPLLECEIGKNTIASQKIDFTPEMKSFVEGIKSTLGVSDVAIYFRDLNNGPIVGVNQDGTFAPASLLKVPVLISYLKWAEEKPDVLTEKILYQAPVDVGYQQQFAPAVPLEVGTTYTAKELLEIMTLYSDNQALVLLIRRLPKHYQEELYTLLGVDSRLISDPTARLTIRQYSIFFRVLFNASFLSRTHSEYALDLLTRTTFEDGVRAGVPLNIPIAHKFGERKISGDLQQFHDCGIVYYPNHPYLLCVMTRGNDVDALIESIAQTSEYVYQKIDGQYGK